MDMSQGSPVTRSRVGHGASEESKDGEGEEEQAVNSHGALQSIPRAEASETWEPGAWGRKRPPEDACP